METEPISYRISNFFAKAIRLNLDYLGITKENVINWYNQYFKSGENLKKDLKIDLISLLSDSEDSRLVIIAKELRKSL